MCDDSGFSSPRLFAPPNLPPLRGPERVALLSLIRFVCEANHLAVSDVIFDLKVPMRHSCRLRSRGIFKGMNLVNQGAQGSERVVCKLFELTGIDGLEQTTLHELINLKGIARLSVKPRRAWCPYCYLDDISSGRSAYERLLWSMAPRQLLSNSPGSACLHMPQMRTRTASLVLAGRLGLLPTMRKLVG